MSTKPEHRSDLAVRRASRRPLRATLAAEKLRSTPAALVQTSGTQAAAARLLGMSRSNFAWMMKRLGVKEPASEQ